jgi:aerobic-type carbon monoxide dehydrogenase small subunit (CoxS/CutS family)
MNTMSIDLLVNGEKHTVDVSPDTLLLYVLRDDLAMTGPKFGCGLSQCGACAVLRDGVEIRSCVTPVSTVVGHEIVTVEGLGSAARMSPLQEAFVAEQAPQCGYCTSGMLIAATALLKKNPKPSRPEIIAGMDGHLCRCSAHMRIIRAIERVAGIKA